MVATQNPTYVRFWTRFSFGGFKKRFLFAFLRETDALILKKLFFFLLQKLLFKIKYGGEMNGLKS